MADYPMISLWAADCGDIVLPDDFPATIATITRMDGWWDHRYKIVRDAKAYIAEQSRRLESGEVKSGFRAPSFRQWRETTSNHANG